MKYMFNKGKIHLRQFYLSCACMMFKIDVHIFRVYTVARPRPHGIFGWGNFLLMFPFRFVYSTIMDILKFACKYLFVNELLLIHICIWS